MISSSINMFQVTVSFEASYVRKKMRFCIVIVKACLKPVFNPGLILTKSIFLSIFLSLGNYSIHWGHTDPCSRGNTDPCTRGHTDPLYNIVIIHMFTLFVVTQHINVSWLGFPHLNFIYDKGTFGVKLFYPISNRFSIFIFIPKSFGQMSK